MQTSIEDISKLKTGTVAEKRAIVETLAASRSPAAVQLLLETLGDGDWTIRKFASEKLVTFGPSIIESLAKVLATGTEDQKFWAVRALVKVGAPSVPLLMRALQKGSKSMRIYAAGALGELRDPKTLPALVTALGDSVWRVRNAAFGALRDFGEEAFDVLCQGLNHESEDVAFWAAKALGKLGDKSRNVLVEKLKTGNPNLKFIIAAALGEMGDRRVIALLIQNCMSKSWIIQHRSSEALIEIGPGTIEQVVEAIRSRGARDTYWLLNVLSHLGDEGLKAIAGLVISQGEEFRWALKDHLSRIGEPILPLLERMTRHKGNEIRFYAVSVLGDMDRSPRIDGVLLKAMGDGSWSIRKVAADALAARGTAVMDRLNLALETGDEDLRYWVTYVFRRMGAPGRDYLVKALGDSNKNIAYFAAQALGETHDPKVIRPLIRALGDPYWPLRKVASESLHQIGPDVIPSLVDSINDECEDIQFWVVKTLKSFGAAGVPEIVRVLRRGNDEQRYFAAKALGVIEAPEAVEPLIEALQDGHEWVRQYVAIALGQIADLRALPHLVTFLEDPNFKLTPTFHDAFRRFGGHAVPHLLALAEGDDRIARCNALRLLGTLNHDKGWEVLCKALKAGSDVSVKLAAIDGIIQCKDRPGAMGELVKMLERTGDAKVKNRLLTALGEFGSEEVIHPILCAMESMGGGDVRDTVLNVLSGFGERAIPRLVSLLGDEQVTTRKASADVLSRIGRVAVPYLEMGTNSPDKNVRFWTQKILKGMRENQVEL